MWGDEEAPGTNPWGPVLPRVLRHRPHPPQTWSRDLVTHHYGRLPWFDLFRPRPEDDTLLEARDSPNRGEVSRVLPNTVNDDQRLRAGGKTTLIDSEGTVRGWTESY